MYAPDNWVVLKVADGDYRVLAGWSGGYLDGDSWRINSGISRIQQTPTHWDFIGTSGSTYHCSKNSETIRMNIASVLDALLDKGAEVVQVKDILDKVHND